MTELVKRFVRFTGVGVIVFSIEITILSILLYLVGISYLPAVIGTYLLVFTVSYFGYRTFAFYGTKRPRLTGFLYFMLIATIGITIITVGSHVLVTTYGVQEIIARITIGTFTGLFNFILNAFVTFQIPIRGTKM